MCVCPITGKGGVADYWKMRVGSEIYTLGWNYLPASIIRLWRAGRKSLLMTSFLTFQENCFYLQLNFKKHNLHHLKNKSQPEPKNTLDPNAVALIRKTESLGGHSRSSCN